MNRRVLALLGALSSACAAATPSAGTTPVIVAGSVCSELPPLPAAAPPALPPSPSLIAFISDTQPPTLVVYDLDAGRERFHTAPIALRSRPEILRDVVVAVDASGQLVGFDLRSGERRFRVSVERPNWLGAAQVGDSVVFSSSSLSFRPAERGLTVTAIDARDGSSRWEKRVPYALSRPQAVGDAAYVISDHADVWALSAKSGAAVGCGRLGSEPIDWLQADAFGLELGSDASVRRGPVSLHVPLGDLPGRPALHSSSYDSAPAGRSAHGRIGVLATVTGNAGALQLDHDRYFYLFYRQLFAFAADGTLEWAQLLESDAVRAELAGELLWVLTEDGKLQAFAAADGGRAAPLKLATRIASADLKLHDTPAIAARATGFTPALPLRTALSALALDTDARLLPGRKLAASALAALPDAIATQDLLQLYTQPGAPAELQKHVASVLAQRKVGSEYLVDALLEDYDFLDDRPAPPLAAIVPGLVANRETRAVPRLVDRLFDPDTEPDELTLVVNALATLAGAEANPPLAKFLALYHADSSLADAPASLIAAAQALSAHAGASETALLASVTHDPATRDGLRAGLLPLMAAATAAAEPAQAKEATPAQAQAALPETLSDDDIQRVFVANADDLRQCVLAELARNPGLRALRMAFVITNDGWLTGLQVLPNRPELVACLKPKLSATRFPRFQHGRRMSNYTIAVRPEASLTPGASLMARESSASFWKLAELRAAGVPKPKNRTPWWRNQNPLYVTVDETPKPEAAEAAAKNEPTPAQPPASEPATKPATPNAQGAPPENKEPPPDAWWLPARP